MKLQFKIKPKQAQILPSLELRETVRLPQTIKRHHVISAGSLSHYINSDLLSSVALTQLKKVGIPHVLDLAALPEGVEARQIGPLVNVTITIP